MWYVDVSNCAKIKRDYDGMADRIGSLQVVFLRKIAIYRKILYAFAEERLGEKQSASCLVETEFAIMSNLYVSLDKRIQAFDEKVNDLQA